MILMRGEMTGEAAEGCYDILVTAYEDEPQVVYVYAIPLVYGDVEKIMDVWHYRYRPTEETAAMIAVPCTPEEYRVARQCDRFFMVGPEIDNSSELPPSLRRYGEQMVEQLQDVAK